MSRQLESLFFAGYIQMFSSVENFSKTCGNVGNIQPGTSFTIYMCYSAIYQIIIIIILFLLINHKNENSAQANKLGPELQKHKYTNKAKCM